MDDTKVYVSSGLIGALIIIILVVLVVLGILTYKPRKRKQKAIPNTKTSKLESFQPSNLKIYNYLEKPITAIYYDPKGRREEVLHPFIYPQSAVSIAREVQKGGKIQFMYKKTKDSMPERIYKDYSILSSELPQEIHVGMVTTKYLNFTSPVFYAAAYEMRFIMMHNRMDVPITINGHIKIPPGEFVRYDGYLRDGGASVGEIFHNDEGYFPPIEIEIPITDLYFGVIDSKPLAVYQGQHYLWDRYLSQ